MKGKLYENTPSRLSIGLFGAIVIKTKCSRSKCDEIDYTNYADCLRCRENL